MIDHSQCVVSGPEYRTWEGGGECRICWLAKYGQAVPGHRSCIAAKANVGDKLKALFMEWGVTPKGGCGCEFVLNEMNKQTPDWCEEHADELAKEIKVSAAKYGWLEALIAINWRMLGSADGRSVILAAASSSPIIDGLTQCVLIAVGRARDATAND